MWKLVRRLLSCGSKTFPTEVEAPLPAKAGRIWVCVGRQAAETERFEVEANYLNHRLFEDLLDLSGQEFGYSYDGALRIACDVQLFLHLLHLLKSSDPSVHYMTLQGIASAFYPDGTRPKMEVYSSSC